MQRSGEFGTAEYLCFRPTENSLSRQIKKPAHSSVAHPIDSQTEEGLKRPKPAYERVAWHQRPFLLSLIAAILLWASFAPLGWWPLAWIATAPWIVLIAKRESMMGRRAYRKVWATGLFHWLAMVYFVTIPHWAGWFGWMLMGVYLSIYIPLFVFFGRCLVYGLKIPVVIAAPTAWVSVELVRAHLFTGLGVVQISHSMFRVPIMIQTADLAGGIGTGFLVVLVTACLVDIFLRWMAERSISKFPQQSWKTVLISRGVTILAVVAFILGYGFWSLSIDPVPRSNNLPPTLLKAALIQGSIDTIFPKTEQEVEDYYQRQFDEYRDLTIAARQSTHEPLDLIVWPESKFPVPVYSTKQPTSEIDENAQNKLASNVELPLMVRLVQGAMEARGEEPGSRPFNDTVPMLTGGTVMDPVKDYYFGSAILFSKDGQFNKTYNKNHRVMFGEYIPFGEFYPAIYDLSPIGRPMTKGDGPKVLEVKDFKIAPNVCFESTVGHLIRDHVNELAASGREPDILANLTDDGWFFGTSCLDMHLGANVFRAIENRKPHLVIANTGFSAHIDSNGRLLQVGPRRDKDILFVEVPKENRPKSLYRIVGDWPAMFCLAMCFVATIVSIRKQKKSRG